MNISVKESFPARLNMKCWSGDAKRARYIFNHTIDDFLFLEKFYISIKNISWSNNIISAITIIRMNVPFAGHNILHQKIFYDF